MAQRLTSSASTDLGIFCSIALTTGGYVAAVTAPTSAAYFMATNYLPTEEKISLVVLGNTAQKYKAGITYKYFVSKAWWNVGGVANA